MTKCSQCDSVTINGVFCHETGCPIQAQEEMRARMEEFTSDWEEIIDDESEAI